MVFHNVGSRRNGEEVPRGFREHRSLERPPRGTFRLLSNASQSLIFEGHTETIGVCLQEDSLWIADPKAINHILQKSGYLYARPSNIRERSALFTDYSILWAEGELSIAANPFPLPSCLTITQGDVHKRHRRAMAPAFGLVGAKGLLPYFMDTSNKAHELHLHWSRILIESPVIRWRKSGMR